MRGIRPVRETLEDAPFYARSLLDTHLLGERVTACTRACRATASIPGWVQALLPFRMPRAWTLTRSGLALGLLARLPVPPQRYELPDAEPDHDAEHQQQLEQHDR